MFYSTLNEIIGTERDVAGNGWNSRRLLLAEDGLPFSVHDTILRAGSELRICYESHSETVYCLEGKGSIEVVAENKIIPIEPGTFYSAGIGDEHVLRADTDIRFFCVFEPPLKGDETAE